jgi:hypothetical protein
VSIFPSGALRLQAILENSYNVATTVKYRNDLQRVGLGPVDNQVGVHRKKLHIVFGEGDSRYDVLCVFAP